MVMIVPFCPKCGSEIFKDEVFCNNCGAKYVHRERRKLTSEPSSPSSAIHDSVITGGRGGVHIGAPAVGGSLHIGDMKKECHNCGNFISKDNKSVNCSICGEKFCEYCESHFRSYKRKRGEAPLCKKHYEDKEKCDNCGNMINLYNPIIRCSVCDALFCERCESHFRTTKRKRGQIPLCNEHYGGEHQNVDAYGVIDNHNVTFWICPKCWDGTPEEQTFCRKCNYSRVTKDILHTLL